MKNYSGSLMNRTQQQPLFGRDDMEQNNAGGYSFKITPKQLLERFLLIGSEGGTYYVSESKLTEDNAKNIINLIKTDGVNTVNTIVDVLVNNKAPKADASLFALALAATYGNPETKKLVYDSINVVCKTSTHLFMFLANIQNLRGWSRGLRNGVAKFYNSKDNKSLAYQLVKYRNRAGFTHKDALRLSHAKTSDEQKNNLFKYAVGKLKENEVNNDLIKNYGLAQTANIDELIKVISKGLSWEMVPTDKLNEPKVLEKLLDNMPLTALIRNLNRFSYTGLTENIEIVSKIVSKLTDKELIKKSGIHPVNVINYLMTYSSGRGQKGSKTWQVNQKIVDALSETYELSVKAVIPTGKRILVGVDISGSMSTSVNGMSLTASQLANVLALTILKTEPNAEVVMFDTGLYTCPYGKRTSIDDVVNKIPNGGGTDCSLPFVYALDRKNKYDAILILTDSETWAGSKHGLTVLNNYRKSVNKNVKVIEIAATANDFSTIPSDDANLLRVVGFDSSVTQLINEFLK